MIEVRHIPINGFVVVQPAFEPSPSYIWKFGPFAAFFYVRWSTIGLGVEVLSSGAAIVIGPLMFGACHIRRQLAAGATAIRGIDTTKGEG